MDDPWSIAILGAIAAWAFTGTLTFFWKRYYLRRAVAEDIQRQQQRIARQEEYLYAFSRRWFVADKVFQIGTYYERVDQSVYRELMAQMVQFSPGSLEKVILFHEAIRTVDSMLANLWIDVVRDKDQKRVLDQARVDYYSAKASRIYAYIGLLTTFGDSLCELPESYDVDSAVDMLGRVEKLYGAASDSERLANDGPSAFLLSVRLKK